MNQLQTHPAPVGVYRTGNALRVAVVVVVSVATFLGVSHLLERPPFVERLSIVNGTSLQLDVDTSDRRAGAWTPAGGVDPRTTTAFPDVVDHGDTWWFRVIAGDRSAVWSVSRAQLDRDHWRIELPRAAVDELGAAPGAAADAARHRRDRS